MPGTAAVPNILRDPGFLWLAPIGTAEPTPTVAGGKFTDALPAAWLPLGATEDGSTFSYSVNVQPIEVAEFLDPVVYATVSRAGKLAFNLANWTLSNLRRALNGGVAALTATGSAGAELTSFEPPDPGQEVRAMAMWESTDATVRMLLRQTLQGGEVASAFKKAPAKAVIPFTLNMETPAGGAKPFKVWGAGTTRV
ncbi:hypothetical protein TEK04_19565 [Klenkia sp. LSe6-5]|uniref:Uncharacterized protein n=1 Tax=Klenkia sesuvii TaxID=3103137 RepID=A0ABU8DYL0_9ACTN